MSKKIENKGKNIDIRSEISLNFRIKVYSYSDKGRTINSLRGYQGLIDLIGQELALKFMINAIMSDQQKIINKLRRGLNITFYSK